MFLSPEVLAKSATGLEEITPAEESGTENTGILENRAEYEQTPQAQSIPQITEPQQQSESENVGYAITAQNFAVSELSVNPCDSKASYDALSALNEGYPPSLQTGITKEPLVLIIHTHATESFAEEGVTQYPENTAFRSTDPEKNMIAVGRVMTDVLNSAGVPTLHCEVQYDAEDYNTAYNKSLAGTKEYLAKYPSLKYVFDVHRDAIVRDNGEMVKTYCNIDGKDCAQVMILVGTNSSGADHPDWAEHLNVAMKIQSSLLGNYPSFARAVSLRGASFNQQYAPGSLLFEIGSCANTLSEAKYAASLLATEIAKTILTFSA